MGLSEINTVKRDNCSVMDIKGFTYFDDKFYLAVAFNSFVQVYQYDKESSEIIKPRVKIDT